MSSDTATRLGEPTPRSTPLPYVPFVWPSGRVHALDATSEPLGADLAAILRERQTRRSFSPLNLTRLAWLLWLGFHTHSSHRSEYGFDQEYRPHPSAGAVHPIHLLLQRADGAPWQRYDAFNHALVEVSHTQALANGARRQAAVAVQPMDGTLVALVAEPGKTKAKYEAHESLVWRDAGVVLGYLSLLSEALDLSFCPLGTTGHDFVAPISPQGKLQGVGLAILGGRRI